MLIHFSSFQELHPKGLLEVCIYKKKHSFSIFAKEKYAEKVKNI